VWRDMVEKCNVCRESRLVVGVSGGADSIALLHILVKIRELWCKQDLVGEGGGREGEDDGGLEVGGGQESLKIEVVHFNHGLREASGEEEEFVSALCESLGVHLHIIRMSAEKAAEFRLNPSGMQEFARNWRRTEMARIARLKGASEKNKTGEVGGRGERGEGIGGGGRVILVTAHHSDDQMETLLLKMLRGVHVTNLQGMAWFDSGTPR
jgi:tRNA(Ile)-lysidine synthase